MRPCVPRPIKLSLRVTFSRRRRCRTKARGDPPEIRGNPGTPGKQREAPPPAKALTRARLRGEAAECVPMRFQIYQI